MGVISKKYNEFKEGQRLRKEERERINREKLQAEKEALMALSEKELLVEVFLALKGYSTRLDSIESDISYLNMQVGSFNSE